MAYPNAPRPARSATSPEATTMSHVASPVRSRRSLPTIVTLLIVLAIIALGVAAIARFSGMGDKMPFGMMSGSSDKWQAVFLTNGQVYFGKIARQSNHTVVIRNVYYLQVVSQQDTIGQPPDVQQQPEQRLTLIKLGNEIHGPQDEISINRDHVVLIEDLKNDSRVVQAINDYLKSLNK